MNLTILPLRITPRQLSLLPTQLHIDSEQQTEGLPWLHGELSDTTAQPLGLALRVHTLAGIPIVEGQVVLEMGQSRFTICDLHALGIEGYAHASAQERVAVAQRIWARCAYGTLRPIVGS